MFGIAHRSTRLKTDAWDKDHFTSRKDRNLLVHTRYCPDFRPFECLGINAKSWVHMTWQASTAMSSFCPEGRSQLREWSGCDSDKRGMLSMLWDWLWWLVIGCPVSFVKCYYPNPKRTTSPWSYHCLLAMVSVQCPGDLRNDVPTMAEAIHVAEGKDAL